MPRVLESGIGIGYDGGPGGPNAMARAIGVEATTRRQLRGSPLGMAARAGVVLSLPEINRQDSKARKEREKARLEQERLASEALGEQGSDITGKVELMRFAGGQVTQGVVTIEPNKIAEELVGTGSADK